MKHWSHGVMKRTEKDGTTWYAIHEVYFTGTDWGKNIDGYTANGVAPGGETLEELKRDLQHMLDACDKPVLDYDDLNKRYKNNKQRRTIPVKFHGKKRHQP